MENIRDALEYDPLTGWFRWRPGHAGRLDLGDGRRAGHKHRTKRYRYVMYNRRLYAEHQLAVFFMTGSMPPKDRFPDHINAKKDDNRWENLRLVTASENMRHARRRMRVAKAATQYAGYC